MQKDTHLSFSISEKDGPRMSILGSRKDLVFNWTAITSQVCKELGIPPFLLAAAMPDMVRDYEGCLGDVTPIALPVPSKERGGGTTRKWPCRATPYQELEQDALGKEAPGIAGNGRP